jgi:hypothetical protein
MITISDLPTSRALDVRAMSSLRGAAGAFGAPWVHSFRAPISASPSLPMVVNHYETNNFTFVDNMVNQFTVLNIENSGDNANLTTVFLGAQNA